jgi:hypothetical protein
MISGFARFRRAKPIPVKEDIIVSNPYLYGRQQAILATDDVDAKWKSEPRALEFLNLSFELYYNAYNAVEATGDDGMRRSLRKAVNTGNWTVVTGWGKLDKLSEGFDHLEKNNGRWTDENTWNYNGGPGRIGGNVFATVPLCAANFLEAVNDAMETLRAALGSFAEGLGKLKEGQDDSNWKKTGEGLEAVEKWGGRAKPLLWVAPETLAKYGDQLLEWNGKILKVHGLASKFMTAAASNQPVPELLLAGLGEVLSYAPMIGGFYGKIVAEIPGMARHWTEFMDDYWARRGTTRYDKNAGWY